MSEAIKPTEEIKPITEVIDPKPIEGDIGEVIIEDGKLFEVEALEEPSKSTKEKDPERGDPGEKPGEPAKPGSSEAAHKDEATAQKMALQDKKIELLEAEIKEANLTPDQIRKRVPLSDLKADIKRQRTILSNIDKELDPDEWHDQNRIVTTLEGDIADKESAAAIAERFNSKDNRDFLISEKKALSDKGFDFSEADWKTIAKVAERDFLVDGKYTSESIRKSLIDILGADATDKMYQVGSEQKLRQDIKDAATKVTKSVRVTRTGVSAKLSSFTQRLMAITDGDVLERELDKLSSEQYSIYKEERKKLKK